MTDPEESKCFSQSPSAWTASSWTVGSQHSQNQLTTLVPASDIALYLSLVTLNTLCLVGASSAQHLSIFTPYRLILHAPFTTSIIPPPKASLSSIKIQISTPQKQQDQVTPDKCSQNAKVHPPFRKAYPKRLVKLISHFIRAVRAVAGLIVDDVARSSGRKKRRHIVPTCLARGSRKVVQFLWRADYRETIELSAHETAHKASEWI